MAYVNKQSLRTEFDALKHQFEELSAVGKVTPESGALFKALLMLFELMVAVFLEKATKKDHKNSSLPSSQVDKDETSLSANPSGKGLKQNTDRFANSRTVETVEISTVDCCETCGEDLHHQPPKAYERRTKIDLVFEKVVQHRDAEIKTCPTCQSTTKGDFPADLTSPLQYGLGIKAYILELVIAQMVSLNRVQKLLQTLLGSVLSQATLLKYILQLDQALIDWEQRSIAQLLAAPVLNVDETSMRVDKSNYWVHVYSTGTTTVKFLHRSRGGEAIDEIDIIPALRGRDCS